MFKRRIAPLALLLGFSLTAASAHATYPGSVGEIAFPMRSGNVDIYSVAADGSGLKQLTHAKGFNGCPTTRPPARRSPSAATAPAHPTQDARLRP